MATALEKLANNLKVYEVSVAYWDEEANDTFLLVGLRPWLQRQKPKMDAGQIERLAVTDEKVVGLAGKYYSDETEDVKDLRLIARLIKEYGSPEQGLV
jgi:hypothetical protein